MKTQTSNSVAVHENIGSIAEKVRALAALGLTEGAIAKELFMSIGTFQNRKRNEPLIKNAYLEGAAEARELRQRPKQKKQRPAILTDADEYVPPIGKIDLLVKTAAESGARRYREICRATGLDDRTVIKALERLQLNGKMTKFEGLRFDEWVVL